MRKIPIGARIRFLDTLTQGPTCDTPAFLFCRKGDGGTVEGYSNFKWPYSVRWDHWHTDFKADDTEFECVALVRPQPPPTSPAEGRA